MEEIQGRTALRAHEGDGLTALRQSNAWDSRYDLPLFPTLNNPWIYAPYADLVLRLRGEAGVERVAFVRHFEACELPDEPGLFHRWPGGGGGLNSWDEIVGAAYFSPVIAERILDHLERTDGAFDNLKKHDPERANVFRLFFLRPYLQACTEKRRVGLSSQLLFALLIVISAFDNVKPGNAGGRLRNWLMISKMERFGICYLAALFWRWKLERAGQTLKDSLYREPGGFGGPGGSTILAELVPNGARWL